MQWSRTARGRIAGSPQSLALRSVSSTDLSVCSFLTIANPNEASGRGGNMICGEIGSIAAANLLRLFVKVRPVSSTLNGGSSFGLATRSACSTAYLPIALDYTRG